MSERGVLIKPTLLILDQPPVEAMHTLVRTALQVRKAQHPGAGPRLQRNMSLAPGAGDGRGGDRRFSGTVFTFTYQGPSDKQAALQWHLQ